MRIELDYPKLMQLADEKGIRSFAALCRISGVNENCSRSQMCKTKSVSKVDFYLFAKALGCHIEDIQKLVR